MENTARQFDYFYIEEADQFTFYRIPRKLFTEEIFKDLACEAKVLYGLMLDRLSLSRRNNWQDAEGRVYIVYGRREAAEELGCGEKKAGRIINELTEAGLVEKKRRGQGKPNVFYVKNFNRTEELSVTEENTIPDEQQPCPVQKGQNDRSRKVEMTAQVQKSQNDRSRKVKMTDQEVSKRPPNKTEKNNNKLYNYPSIHPSEEEDRRITVRRMIDYDALVHDMPLLRNQLDEIVDLIADIMNAPPDAWKKIDGTAMRCSDIQKQFGRLNMSHIQYVLSCLDETSRSSRIRNIKAYLLTALYNAPLTISSYYSAMVNHDMHMAEGG